MLCFSFYMAYAWQHVEAQRLLLVLFAVQWILNVAWNPVFFRFQMVTPGLMVIVALTILVGTMLFLFKGELGWKSLLILPYLLWLLVATSLNGYILVNN